MKRPTVGTLREQTALCDANNPILIVTKNPNGSYRRVNLEVVHVFPDTDGFFKIEVTEPK